MAIMNLTRREVKNLSGGSIIERLMKVNLVNIV